MLYIIDANNLAGKLNLLKEDNFDKKLIESIKKYSLDKNNYCLVFDSNYFMGDKFVVGNIEAIYAPRDNFYKSADDKILELAKNATEKIETIVITDDIEIIEKIKKLNYEKINQIKIIRSTDFAQKIKRRFKKREEDGKSEKELDDKITDDINNELLNIWK